MQICDLNHNMYYIYFFAYIIYEINFKYWHIQLTIGDKMMNITFIILVSKKNQEFLILTAPNHGRQLSHYFIQFHIREIGARDRHLFASNIVKRIDALLFK